MICPACGTASDGPDYCPNCLGALAPASPPPSARPAPTTPDAPRVPVVVEPAPEKATQKLARLREQGVDARLEPDPGGFRVVVPMADVPLAVRHLSGEHPVPPEAQQAPASEPPSAQPTAAPLPPARRTHHTGQVVGLAFLVSVAFQLVAGPKSSTSGALFGLFLLAYGIWRTLLRLAEPDANPRSLWGLTLVLGSYFMVSVGNQLSVLAESKLVLAGFAGLAALVLLAGMVLSLVGLVEISGANGRFRTGKGHSIAALCFSGVFFLLFGGGVVVGIVQARNRPLLPEGDLRGPVAVELRNPELNFRLEPMPGWSEVKDPKKLNPSATSLFVRTSPQAFFMIIAEQFDTTPDAMLELWRTLVTGANGEVLGTREATLDGFPGVLAEARVKPAGTDLFQSNWIGVRNGYAYQLVGWGPWDHREKVLEAANAARARFHLLDPAKVAPATAVAEPEPPAEPELPAEPFASSTFSYRVDLQGAPWRTWRSLGTEAPSAEFGAQCGTTGRFTVMPFPLPTGVKVPEAALLAGLLKRFALNPRAPSLRTTPATDGALRGSEIEAVRTLDDGATVRFRLRALSSHDRAFLVAHFQNEGDATVKDCPDPLPRVRFEAPAPLPKELPRPARTAGLWADVGAAMRASGAKEPGLVVLRRAVALAPEDGTVLTALLDALEEEGRNKEALGLLEAYLARRQDDANGRARRASLLAALGRAQEANAEWSALFKGGHQNDDDLEAYADHLEARGDLPRAIAELEAARGRQDTPRASVLLGQALARAGQRDKAVQLLAERQKTRGFDPLVASALAQLHLDARRPAECLELCETLLARGVDWASVYLLQARAQVALGWLPKARESLEEALHRNPGSEFAQSLLAHVVRQLGQSDTKSIREPIDAVAVPADLLEAPADVPTGHGAAYLSHVVAVSFKPGKDHRITEYHSVRIDDLAGVSRFGTFEFELDPLREQLFVNSLEVLDSTGKVLSTGQPTDYYLSDRSDEAMGTDSRSVFLPVAGLKPGTRLRLVVSRRLVAPPAELPFDWRVASGAVPRARAAVVLAGDAASATVVATGKPAERRVAQGRVFEWTGVPAYDHETLEPGFEHFLPSLTWGKAEGTWAEVGKEYLETVKGPLQTTPQLERIALTRVGKARTPAQKVAALARWVQHELSYRAIEFGPRARVPQPPAEVLARRYGDCKDHAVLLALLLQAAGVQAWPALVQTGRPVVEALPSLDQFDHMVTFVPGVVPLVVDATSKHGDPVRPYWLRSGPMLVLDPAEPRLVTLDPLRGLTSELRVEREVRVGEDGTASVQEALTLVGPQADYLRISLDGVEPARQTETIRHFLPDERALKLRSTRISGLEDPTGPVALEVAYDLGKVFHKVGDVMVGRLPAPWERMRIVPRAQGERRHPFELRLPLGIRSAVKLRAPKGWRGVAGEPASQSSGDGSFASWSFQPGSGGATVESRFEFDRGRGTFPAPRYAAYAKAMDEAASQLEREVVLERESRPR